MPMEIPERDSVLHGHDDGLRPDEARRVGRDVGELVRLHGQHDDVLRADGGVVVRRRDLAHRRPAAVARNEANALPPDRFQVRAANHESDIAACRRELRTHEAADGARPDHRNLDVALPLVRWRRSCGKRCIT